jgi:cytochrome c556
MKLRLLSLSLLSLLISVSGVRAEGTSPAPGAPPAAKPEKPETELEQTMGKMNKAWRQIRKATKDGKLTSAMAPLVATVRTNAEAAAKLTPALEGEKPAADRAKFHADFQAQIKKLTAKLTELEAALTANDIPGATRLVGETGEIIKGGHHEFKKPDEHEKH